MGFFGTVGTFIFVIALIVLWDESPNQRLPLGILTLIFASILFVDINYSINAEWELENTVTTNQLEIEGDTVIFERPYRIEVWRKGRTLSFVDKTKYEVSEYD